MQAIFISTLQISEADFLKLPAVLARILSLQWCLRKMQAHPVNDNLYMLFFTLLSA